MKADLSNPRHVKVLAALRMPQYVWRTVEGVARDTGLTPKETFQALIVLDEDVVVRPGVPAALFAARDHLIKSQTWYERVWAALNNRVY